jgi:hypothetical protein
VFVTLVTFLTGPNVKRLGQRERNYQQVTNHIQQFEYVSWPRPWPWSVIVIIHPMNSNCTSTLHSQTDAPSSATRLTVLVAKSPPHGQIIIIFGGWPRLSFPPSLTFVFAFYNNSYSFRFGASNTRLRSIMSIIARILSA